MHTRRHVAIFVVIILSVCACPAFAQDVLPEYKDYEGTDPSTSVLAFLEQLVRRAGRDAVLFDLKDGALADQGSAFQTAEGRTIKVLKLTKNARIQNDPGKRDFLMTGCHHAREWITVEFLLRFAEFLVEKRNAGGEFYFGVLDHASYTVPTILERSEILFVVVLNPDGYVYSRAPAGAVDEQGNDRRNWRKNRRKVAGTPATAVGVDINRNYPNRWDPIPDPNHTSDDPNIENYRGPAAGSEREIQAIAKLHDQFNVMGVVNFHSFNPAILYPFAFRKDPIPDDQKILVPERTLNDNEYFKALCGAWSERAFVRRDLLKYPFAQSGSEDPNVSTAYRTSGDADDWAYEIRKAASITIELTNEHKPRKAKQNDVFAEAQIGLLSFIFNNLDRHMRARPRLRDGAGRRDR